MLNCPLGLIAGTSGNANITGCENGTLQWSSDTNDLNILPQPGGNAILTVGINGNGVATITVDCNIDGVTETFTCQVNLIPPDQELVCEISPPLAVAFETCGQICECGTAILIFDCDESGVCDTKILSVQVKDCEAPEPEPCPPSIPLLLRGTENV